MAVDCLGVEMIGPERAEELLDGSKNWRKASPYHVNDLAGRMERGEWNPDDATGCVIALNKQGRLVDGQHTLLAIIRSGKEYPFVILHGCVETGTSDRGVPRTYAQWVQYEKKVKNASAVSSITHLLAGYKERVEGESCFKSRRVGVRLSFKELDRIRSSFKGVARAASWVKASPRECRPQAIFGALHVILHKVDAAMADDYFEVLKGDTVLRQDDAVMLLRKQLINTYKNPLKEPPPFVKSALAIVAWNHWRTNKPCKRLVWNATGKRVEPFPEIL